MTAPAPLSHLAAPLRTLLACLLALALLLQAQVAHANWACELGAAHGETVVQQPGEEDCHGAAVDADVPAHADHGDQSSVGADDDCRVSPACCHAVALPTALQLLEARAASQRTPEAAPASRPEIQPAGFERPPRLA